MCFPLKLKWVKCNQQQLTINAFRVEEQTSIYTATVTVPRLPEHGKIQSDTKKRELLKNPTKIEEIKKHLLTEIEPLQLAFQETVIQIINV